MVYTNIVNVFCIFVHRAQKISYNSFTFFQHRKKKINQFSFSCVKIMPFFKNKLNSKIELIYAFQLHAHCKEV